MKQIRYPISVFLAVSILVPVSFGIALAKNKKNTNLPMTARLVIAKVSPMLQEKDYTKAIETLVAFQARGGVQSDKTAPDPKGYHHPEIYLLLGNCYLMQEDYNRAGEAYRNGLERDPTNAAAWLNLAKISYQKNHFSDAGNCFLKSYEFSSKKNPAHLYFAAASHMMASNNLRAIEIFEMLFSSHPSDVAPEWKEHLVQALLAAEKPRRALPIIRELARTYTGDKQIQWQEILLYQYLQLKLHKEALSLARSLTRQAPSEEKWWKALVHVQLDAGRQEEALMAMTVYSFLKPLTLEEKELLADLEMLVGIPAMASPLYEAYLEEKPKKDTLRRLVAAYQQLGQSEKALAAINKFDPSTEDEDLLLLLGELHYSRKHYAQAADFYRQAAKLKGRQTGRAWLMAGYSAWQLEDIKASKQAFRHAAAYKTQKKAATAALQQLVSAESNGEK